MLQTHSDVTQAEIDQLEASHAKCPVCNAVFRSVDIMKVHLRRHDVTALEASQQQQQPTTSAAEETAVAADDESKLKVDEDMEDEDEEEDEEDEDEAGLAPPEAMNTDS